MQTAATAFGSDRLSRVIRRHSALSVDQALIRDNLRIEVISGCGVPTPVPVSWRPILKESDVLVVVPDMHMYLYSSVLDNFRYGAESMLDFLIHVEACRRQLARQGLRLSLCQLGDMYEFCYPNPGAGRRLTVRDIRASHPIYDEIIRPFHDLNFRYVVGNHDADDQQRKGGVASATDGSVYMEHGYSADRWYRFSNPNHRHWRMTMGALRSFRRIETEVKGLRGRFIDRDNTWPSAIGIGSGVEERDDLPDPRGYPRRQLRYFSVLVKQATPSPRVCVIAHTHRPYLNPRFAGGRCIYVDTGAWTEGRSDFAVITNAEIAICRYMRTAWPMARPTLRPAS